MLFSCFLCPVQHQFHRNEVVVREGYIIPFKSIPRHSSFTAATIFGSKYVFIGIFNHLARVAHICTQQTIIFLKYNTIFVKQKRKWSKHNTELLKHNNKLSKYNTKYWRAARYKCERRQTVNHKQLCLNFNVYSGIPSIRSYPWTFDKHRKSITRARCCEKTRSSVKTIHNTLKLPYKLIKPWKPSKL